MKRFLILFALLGLSSCSKRNSVEQNVNLAEQPGKAERIQELFIEGDQFASKGRYDLARSRYDSVLVIDPYNSDAIKRISRILQPLPRNIRKENGQVYITVFQTPGDPWPTQTAVPMASPPRDVVNGVQENANYYTLVMTEKEWEQMQRKIKSD